MYLASTDEQESAARIARPPSAPDGELPKQALGFRVQAYGMTAWSDLFISRQLVALTTFSDLVKEARERILKDALGAGSAPGDRLEEGGVDAEAYADAVATYLGIGVSRYSNFINSLCQWRPDAGKEQVGHLFARQAIAMVWDFAESSPWSNSAGGWLPAFRFIVKALDNLMPGPIGRAWQGDAATEHFSGILISTDPPYYDNIGYSDLSDFFYIWLRRSLQTIHPDLLSTLLVPKSEELVANQYRQGGREAAKRFFENGFRKVFARVRSSAWPDLPITVYYAFKQSDSDDDGAASTGWETLLDGMIQSRWCVTATWPMRSELGNRIRSQGSNALASSIVLVLRPRAANAPSIDRRGFIAALQAELPKALRDLQQGVIAPVDLPQAAIGPGMAVFSRYSSVIEADGSPMPVRAALARINEVLDQVLNEQEGDFDGPTRFAVAWYRQHGYTTGKFGDADNVARARGTAVESLDRDGILTSRAGKVTLLRPTELPAGYDPRDDDRISVWEVTHHLVRALETEGIPAAGQMLMHARARAGGGIDANLVKELAFLLFRVADGSGWAKDAVSFNNLATSWTEITDAAGGLDVEQIALDLEGVR
ncbi:DUF1156 domain-containing protein [Actinoplanes sp. TBRC 11911]|uniref:DUF1156 domain-containing protein n=1 Tax=Actinoplanes sp. TBRC 11911 TaxID=2729386 RepID=UPI001B7D64A9|nr:DUF1156 domain-containing protein [Actinoplanes sp. TBRC 11911]